MSTEGAANLGHHVRERRKQLDLNQLEIHAAGGPSNSTLTTIENDRLPNLGRATARKIDRGLQWEPGSARRVWEGGEPIPLIPGVPPRESADWRRLIEESDLDQPRREALISEIQRAIEAG